MLVQILVGYLKAYGRVNSPAFVLGLLGIGILLLFTRRFAHWGRRWLVALLLGLWFLATPIGSEIVAAPLSIGQHRIESADQAAGAQAVVVLGGGLVSYFAGDLALDDLDGTALRVLEGARVAKLLGDPLVVVSGGSSPRRPRPEADAMRDAMVKLGVPASRILIEDRSRTTRDEAVILKGMFAERHIERFVLVTSPTHLGRSVSTFRAVGLVPIPSASLLRSDSGGSLWTLVPDRDSLDVSDSAIYDAVAWVYYWWRGWLR